MFIIAYWNILMMGALKSLSDNSNICVISVFLCVVFSYSSFDFSDSWYYKWFSSVSWTVGGSMRLWILFKSILAVLCWHHTDGAKWMLLIITGQGWKSSFSTWCLMILWGGGGVPHYYQEPQSHSIPIDCGVGKKGEVLIFFPHGICLEKGRHCQKFVLIGSLLPAPLAIESRFWLGFFYESSDIGLSGLQASPGWVQDI